MGTTTPSVYPLLLNLRSYARQIIESRPGTALINFAAAPVHSLKRLNDYLPGASQVWTRIIGAADKLFSGQSSFTQRAAGFSGNPLALVDYRPAQSPESWCYVGDSAKMGKIKTDGTFYDDGIAPPLAAPSAVFGVPKILVIDLFSDTVAGLWVAEPTANSLGESTNTHLNTTISEVLYDSGTTGWASILLADQGGKTAAEWIANLGPGSMIALNGAQPNAETVEVQGIYRGVSATTLDLIYYYSGTTGLCWIVPHEMAGLTTTLTEDGSAVVTSHGTTISPGTIVQLNGGANIEFVTVISMTTAPDGSAAFSCITKNTHLSGMGETISVAVATIRCYCAKTHAAGETATAGYFSWNVPAPAGFLVEIKDFDLTQIAGQGLQDEDEFHLSVYLDDCTKIQELRVVFDVDSETVAYAGNAFLANFYYMPFRQSDFAAAADGGLTTLQGATISLQNAQIGVSSTQLPQGLAAQWYELFFTVGQLKTHRVGTDTSRDLSTVKAISISLWVNPTMTASVGAAALTLRATSGPNVGTTGAPYLYRQRFRSSKTGALSQLGPPTRGGLQAHDESILVSGPDSSDSQVDLKDTYRYGGNLQNWRYVGTGPNPSIGPFDDLYQDLDIANSELATFDDYRPFPTVDIPRSGVCNVCGPVVTWLSGDMFNPLWAPGSLITINGIDYTLYNYPSPPTLELVESAGAQLAVPFLVKQATLDAQPLPCLWGPFLNMLLACGSPREPGKLFATKGNNPDSAPDTYNIEITTPSEPLMNGCMYGGYAYVYSNKRAFVLSQDYTGENILLYTEIPDGFGIFSRWGLCIGKYIYGIWTTGIWRSVGGPSTMITDPDLTMLFPHDGQPGEPVTLGNVTVYPPDFTQTSNLRLSWADFHLKFDYIDVNQQRTTLVYNEIFNRWGIDIYAFYPEPYGYGYGYGYPTGTGAVIHYQEEAPGLHSNLIGASDGNVYVETGSTDDGNAFESKLMMPQVGGPLGFQHVRDGYLGLMTADIAEMLVNVDGTEYAQPVASAGGVYQRLYTPLPALKAKTFEWGFTSTTPWKVWISDTFFRVKAWASDAYEKFSPFSNLRREL